jgi:cytochrome b
MPGDSLQTVRIWDLPTRVFHWSLAAGVIALFVTGKIGGDAMLWHSRAGYAVASLLLARIGWGFVGGHWSRFSAFRCSPRAVMDHLRRRADSRWEVGHTPVAALAIYAMLTFLLAQAGSGLFSDDRADFSGPLSGLVSGQTVRWLTAYHKDVGEPVLLVLVALHLGAVGYYRLRKKQDLIGPMWHGDKRLGLSVPSARDDLGSRLMAAVLLGLCSALVAWVVNLGS